jgi:hypothetical protein
VYRNVLGTGLVIRLAINLFCLFKRTMEFVKKFKLSPAFKFKQVFDEIKTALYNSPFFTLDVERRFARKVFIDTKRISPTKAYCFLQPETTLMQKAILAPELSITFKKVPF